MNKLTKFFLRIHSIMPLGIRRIYIPIIIVLREIRSLILPLYCYEGEDFSTGNHISIAYLGWDKRISIYWVDRFIKDKKRVTINKLIPTWKVHKYLGNNKDKFDLGIAEITLLTKKILRLKSGFILPRWLEMRLDIKASAEIIRKSKILRIIRKHSFTIEKKYSEEDLNFFYERMYKPYIISRHKDSAVIGDYKYFLSMFKRKGFQLFFLIKDGQAVAGSIHEIKDNTIRLSGVGVLDGRIDIFQMGVNAALYFFEVNDYLKKNVSSINIGGTSPVLTDGLTRFKLHLGAKLTDKKSLGDQFVWLIPLVNSKAVRSILTSNPFISLTEEGFYRNIFVDIEKENAKDEFLEVLKLTECDEVKATRIYHFDDTVLIAEWINKDECLNVEIAKYIF